MGVSQEDWEVSSLDLRKPDKPSCPVLNSGLALSWETLASHDSWDQSLMSAARSCLILRIALLMVLHRGWPNRPSNANQALIKRVETPVNACDWYQTAFLIGDWSDLYHYWVAFFLLPPHFTKLSVLFRTPWLLTSTEQYPRIRVMSYSLINEIVHWHKLTSRTSSGSVPWSQKWSSP